MDAPPSQVVSDIGNRLALALSRKSLPKNDLLRKYLRQAANALSELDQTQSLESIVSPLSDSLVKRGLLQHKDKEVRLYMTICLTEIVRVLAPEPPFSDSTLRDIFKLILCVFAELADTKNAYFLKRVKIVETIAELKFCFQMLDVGCGDLILEMFNIFFSIVRNDHPLSLVDAILSMMTLILKEEVSWPLLEVILQNLLKEGKGAAAASHDIAVRVIENCTKELEPYVCAFLASCISDKDCVESELKDFYHEIIFEIFQCTPQMLGLIIPSLTQELLADQVDVRIKAVNIVGKLFEFSGCHVPEEYSHLFKEFLNRLSDKSVEVRLNALQRAKACYLCNPRGPESAKIMNAIEGRMWDCDDRVRTHSVEIACDLACSTLKYVSVGQISRIVERLRDKKVSVRKSALRKLLELYREYCIKRFEAHGAIIDHFEQIPCNILMLCYDKGSKEFGPQNLVTVLGEDLFPASLSVVEQTAHWISLFSLFKPVHVKALGCILSLKLRLQTELRGYLAIRKKQKYVPLANGSEEVQDRIKSSFTEMSTSFPDPHKAEECFHRLDKVKDNNFFHKLAQLLDEVTIGNAQNVRDRLIKIIGEKHPEFDFLCSLYSKCSNNIFCSDHIGCILDDISSKSSENELLEVPPSVGLFGTVVGVSPSLLRGCEAQFQELFLKENLFHGIKARLIQVLAKVGSHVAIKPSVIYPCLERVCLEGDRTQSKYAVSALAALRSNSESSLFTELFEKLMNALLAGKNIPTVLQSLGCIAQYSAVTFQMHDQAIRSFIMEKIFESHQSDDVASFDLRSGCRPSGEQSDDMVSFCERSGLCMLKIYALKMLVKSFLPHQRIHGELQIDNLLGILSTLLGGDEVFGNDVSGENDRAHIRFAAAKSVLRLSRRWDFHINPQLFHSTIMMAKYSSSSMRKQFIVKVRKFLRERAMPSRYACAYPLALSYSTDASLDSLQDESLNYMAEFVRERSKGVQIHEAYVKQGGSITNHPAYIVVYLIHVLAHDIEFPSENCLDHGIFARFCCPLFFTLAVLVDANHFGGDCDLVKDTVSHLLNIFHAISMVEDAVDARCTPKVRVLSDIGTSILNILNNYGLPTSPTPGKILLPSSLYKKSLAKASKEPFSSCAIGKSFIQKVVNILKPLAPKSGEPLAKRCKLFQEDTSQLDVGKSAMNLPLCKPKDVDLLMNVKKTEGKVAFNHGTKNLKTGKKQSRSQKQVRSTNASCLTGLNDSSKVDEQRNVISKNSGPVLEKEQLLYSYDSVAEPSASGSRVLSQNLDIVSSCSPKENDGTIRSNSNTEGHSECSWSDELKDHCNLKDIMQNRGANIQRVSVVHSSVTSQQGIVDLAQLKDTLSEKEKGSLFVKVLPAPARRKKGRVASAKISSEVVNVNDDCIARRTRRRKV